MYWGKPQFFGVRGRAAGLGSRRGDYTAEQFRQDYPQFFTSGGKFLGSEAMLCNILSMANAAVQPDKWMDMWRYGVGLYVAHYATLHLRGYAPSSDSAQAAAASGALVGAVRSATLGDASVSYDTSAVTTGTEDWGDLNATTYGQMFANRAKLIGMAGTYVM